MEMIILKPDSSIMLEGWEWLSKHPLNADELQPCVAMNPLNGECWQYMCSYRQSPSETIISDFRHRSLAPSNDRITLSYTHTEKLSEEDILTIIK